MIRTKALAQIASTAAQLDDAQLEALAEYTAYLAGPTVYATLPEADKVKIEQALDALDRGEAIPAEQVFAELEAHIRTARQGA